jgi:hypothetical protein
MNSLKSVFSELLGLFVDDGSFVLAVIAWVLGSAICLRTQVITPPVEAVLLFVGIIVLLAENVERTARTHTRSQTEE